MRETISKTVENEDVIGFAELSGDRNPIHLSEHFARKTRFGGRIVQTFNLRGSNMNRHSETSATAQKELTAKRSGIASIWRPDPAANRSIPSPNALTRACRCWRSCLTIKFASVEHEGKS